MRRRRPPRTRRAAPGPRRGAGPRRPGRTATTSPADGRRRPCRAGRRSTIRQRSRWPGTSDSSSPSPARPAGAGRRRRAAPSGRPPPAPRARRPRPAGITTSSIRRSREVLEERVAGLDGVADLDQRPVAGREHEPRLEARSTSGRTGDRRRASSPARRHVASRVDPRPHVGLPRRQQVAAALEPVGQAQRARRAGRRAGPPRPPVDLEGRVARRAARGRPRRGTRSVDDRPLARPAGRRARGRRARGPAAPRRPAPRTTSVPPGRPGAQAGRHQRRCPAAGRARRAGPSMIRRRSSGSGIVPSGARSRAWSRPSARTPGRRSDVGGRQRDRRPPARRSRRRRRRSTSSGGGSGVERRRGGEQALDGGPRGGQPQQRAVAGGVAPRRQGELAQPVADAEPVERDAEPADDRVEVRVAERRAAGARRRRRSRRRAAASTAPSRRRRRRGGDARPGRLADLDDLDPPAEDLGERRRSRPPSARRPSGPSPRSVVEQHAQRGPAALRGRRRRAASRPARSDGIAASIRPPGSARPPDEHGDEVGPALRRPRRRS